VRSCQGYPTDAKSEEVSGPADGTTEVTIARIQAYSASFEQLVDIELQIQFDGDYLDWRNASLETLRPPQFSAGSAPTFASALRDAGERGLLRVTD
jgi:hypothetical protein